MLARITTVAFQGIKAVPVDIQVQLSNGLPGFTIVGLADKTVAESKERIRSALNSMGLSLPPKRIVVNLSPADMQKEGSHFDLPIAIAILIALNIIPDSTSNTHLALGELSLAGEVLPVNGALSASLLAAEEGKKVVCPIKNSAEAYWGGSLGVMGVENLQQVVQALQGNIILDAVKPSTHEQQSIDVDLAQIKGQNTAKRALEVAAAGGHNLLMVGGPGAGKSMLAQALPGILPTLAVEDALEVSMIQSIAGQLTNGVISLRPPFRSPHHSASMAAMVGGGAKAKPGEVSLSHKGVLFLDELPEFQRATLEALRQPLESGNITISRAQSHITYPANVQLIAAMNPCKCGYADDLKKACSKLPRCVEDYQSKISGPLLDRIDLKLSVQTIELSLLKSKEISESSQVVQKRVQQAHNMQLERFKKLGTTSKTNSELKQKELEAVCGLSSQLESFFFDSAEKLGLSARGVFRTLKVARTIADLSASESISQLHLSEALSYRLLY